MMKIEISEDGRITCPKLKFAKVGALVCVKCNQYVRVEVKYVFCRYPYGQNPTNDTEVK